MTTSSSCANLYTSSVRRCWRTFDSDTFRDDLLTSVLCDVTPYGDLDCDALASLYDTTVQELLDRQVPARTVTCRRRGSNLFGSTMNVVARSNRYVTWRRLSVVMVHIRPLPRGALNDVLTSTCYVGSDRRIGRIGTGRRRSVTSLLFMAVF